MTTNHRTDKDFAIEFGGYLASAAEHFMTALEDSLPDCLTFNDDAVRNHWIALQSAIHEFRTRADFAKRDKITRSIFDILTTIREIARS